MVVLCGAPARHWPVTCGFEADWRHISATRSMSYALMKPPPLSQCLSGVLSIRTFYGDSLTGTVSGSVCVSGVGVDVVTRIFKVKRLSAASETPKASFLG